MPVLKTPFKNFATGGRIIDATITDTPPNAHAPPLTNNPFPGNFIKGVST
jgi:hypothetical protein